MFYEGSDRSRKRRFVAGTTPSSESLPMIFDDSDSWDDSDLDEAKPKGSPESIRLENIARTSVDVEVGEGENESEKATLDLRNRRGSDATDQTFMLYTPDEEQSVVEKFDRRLVLFVALLYMLSFLDRSSMQGPAPFESYIDES